MESKTSFSSHSDEELKKAEFLMEAEYILLQVDHGQISIGEGYKKLINLLGDKEMEAVLESLYDRIAS